MSEADQNKQEARVMKKTPKEEIQNRKGKYDDDGFYILEDGDFYDPNGYYFDTKGFDATGGSYDEEGVYVPGNLSSGFTRSDKLVALSKEEIKQLHPDGKEDDDGFYVLKDGDFYDPFGYYFDVEGLDVTGGSYDAQGYYISGTELATRPLILTKEEIEKLNPDGTFDEDGFYILKDGDFYDPLGYYFDKDGYDETGGKYDDAGYYIPAPEHVDDRVQSLTKEEVLLLHPEGKFDDDEFLHLQDGDYFDPLGYYFNSDGKDANGGRYDDQGFYIAGKPRNQTLKDTSKEEILKEEGKYNEFGFYQLVAGGFYDPFGFKFDQQGLDAVGGFYEDGLYMDPDEEYRHDSEEDYDSEGADYGAEEYSQFSLDEIQEDEALERQAVVNEHVVPAQYQVKKELLVDKKKHFYLRVANLPEHFELEDFHKFFQKQVPHFKHSKMMPLVLKHDKSFLPGNVLIQTSDINTIDKLLGLHGRKFNGYPLSCWLMGFDHVDTDEYNLEFDPFFYEEQFQKSKKQEAKKSKENPESVKTDAKQVVTQDEEFEVKKIVRGQQTVTVEDEEFQITKKA